MRTYSNGIGAVADPDDVMADLRLEREERERRKDTDALRRTCERMTARADARALMRKIHLPLTEMVR
jgi:hypothetical protein